MVCVCVKTGGESGAVGHVTWPVWSQRFDWTHYQTSGYHRRQTEQENLYRLYNRSVYSHIHHSCVLKQIFEETLGHIFFAVETLFGNPADCSQTLLGGETSSGPYTIYINGDKKQPVGTYCDMTTDGGGWMVFLQGYFGLCWNAHFLLLTYHLSSGVSEAATRQGWFQQELEELHSRIWGYKRWVLVRWVCARAEPSYMQTTRVS